MDRNVGWPATCGLDLFNMKMCCFVLFRQSGSKRPNTSPLPSHHRTKSSPFPFAVQPVTATTPDSNEFFISNMPLFISHPLYFVFDRNPSARRFSSSDSISELDATAKRNSNNKDTDSPTHGTPPGTPPPPYRRPVSPLTEDANGGEVMSITRAVRFTILLLDFCVWI